MPGSQASHVFLSCSVAELTRIAPPVQSLLQYLRGPIEVSLKLMVRPPYLSAISFAWYQNRPLAFTMVPPVVGQAVDARNLDSGTREPLQTVLKDPEFALGLLASRELQRPAYLLAWNEALRSSTAVAFNIGTIVSGMVIAPAGTPAAYAFGSGKVGVVSPPPPPQDSLQAALRTLRDALPEKLADVAPLYAAPETEVHSFLLVRARNLVVPPLYVKHGPGGSV